MAIGQVVSRLIGKDTEELFANMGKTWDYLTADPQLRWIGPEKGVIHIATGAVNNAVWDMYARSRNKPLWKLVVDFTPVRHIPRSLISLLTMFIGGIGRVCRLALHLRRYHQGGSARYVQGPRSRQERA